MQQQQSQTEYPNKMLDNVPDYIKPAIEDMIVSLDDLAHGTEDDFITLGNELQKIYNDASTLGNRISENMRVFDLDYSDGVLGKINLYTQTSQTRTSQALTEVENLRQSLFGVVSLLDKIFRNTDTLGRTSMYLRVLGVYIGIECARKAQAGSIFSVVAADTVTLSEKINEITDNIINHTTEAKGIQTESYANTAKSSEQLQALTREAEQTASLAFQHVSELVDISVQALKRANTISLEITKEVGAVVMGIQFHDNLRQRIEHIIHALTDAISLLYRSKNGDSAVSNSLDNRLSEVYGIIELQESQLDLLLHETEKLYQEQQQSFDRISQGIVALTDCLKDIDSGEQTSGRDHDSLLMLADTTKTISDARTSSESLSGEIKQTAERAFQVTTRLTGYVEETSDISHQIHINALNSIIQAEKLGIDGKPLQVISQDMVAVSRQVEALVPNFMKLVGEIKEVIGANKQDNGDGQSPPDDMVFDPGTIYQSFQEFKNNSQKLMNEGKALGQAVAGEQEKLSFLRSIIERIQNYKLRIHELAKAIRPLIEHKPQNRQLFSEELAKRYTMEQERAAHRKASTEDKDIPLSSSDNDSIDDIFFTDDIDEEVYEDEAPLIEEEQVNGTAKAPDMAEALQTLPTTEQVVEDDKVNKENSLGDNVELF